MTLERLSLGEIREPDKIASFVLGASRQSVIDMRRGQRRRDRLLDMYGDDLPLADATPATNWTSLDSQRLQKCLEKLSERERTIIVMSFYDERPSEEVAEQLSVSSANVRVIRHRGIERLRRCMEGKPS